MRIINKKEAAEKLLTLLVFTGIFLPVRLVFYNYVSQYWLGSFGLMSVMLLSLVYLSKKGKLGWLGVIILRHVNRFARGKFGLGIMVSSVFFLYFFGNMIYGIETAPMSVTTILTGQLRQNGIESLDDVPSHPASGFTPPMFLSAFILLLIPSPITYSVYDVINTMSNGWVLHFGTVLFVEQLEILCLLIYFRYIKKDTVKS